MLNDFVYVFKDEHNNVKIGVSKHPEFRCNQLATLLKRPVQVVATYPCGKFAYKVERQLHLHFEKECLGNEWFSLTQKEVDGIPNLLKSFKEALDTQDEHQKQQNTTDLAEFKNKTGIALPYSIDARKNQLASLVQNARASGKKVKLKDLATAVGVSSKTVSAWLKELL